MSLNVTAQPRPLQPGTDEVIYLQTPRGTGGLDLPEEDSWDLAEEKARQEAASATPPAGDDIESASTDSSSDSSSVGSAASANASASAAASTATSAASSATGKMTTAAPANAPAKRGFHPGLTTAFCASATLITFGTGIMFTLMATGDIPTNRPQYPEEITVDKAFAGITYLVGVVTSIVTVRYAIKAATNNS